jgi:hypothetical protein
VGLEDLADVHAARDAERVEDDVDGRAVLEERHVLLVDDLRDDALVAVAAGELVALGDLALLGHEHATRSLTPGGRSSPFSRENVMTSMTTPPSPWGTFSEVSRTSRAFSLKIARISFSSAVSSVSPFGVTLPTSRSPEPTSAPMRTMPRSSRLRSDSSERFGMSRVISSSPSLVVRASISYSSMWIEVSSSSLTRRLRQDDRVLEVVALPGHEGDHQVLAQRHLAVVGRRAVGEDVARP